MSPTLKREGQTERGRQTDRERERGRHGPLLGSAGRPTHLGGSSILLDDFLDGVKTQAVAHVSHLEGVDITVTTIPEIEQFEHLGDV